MQTSEDNSWERFIDTAMQEARPEELTGDFTDKVLTALETLQESPAVTRYKAPISRFTWIVLGFVFTGILLWGFLSGTSFQSDWTSEFHKYFDFSGVFGKFALPALEYASLYSIGFFALFFMLQLLFIKRLFDRRLGLV